MNEIREKMDKLLRLHEAKLVDIEREELTTEGYIIREESNRNKTTKAILSLETDTHKIIVVKKGEPPLLTDQEVAGRLLDKPYNEDYELMKRGAQRSSDIEYYKGE